MTLPQNQKDIHIWFGTSTQQLKKALIAQKSSKFNNNEKKKKNNNRALHKCQCSSSKQILSFALKYISNLIIAYCIHTLMTETQIQLNRVSWKQQRKKKKN